MKISESIVGLYVISQLIFLGGREIAQEGGKIVGGKIVKILPKILGKFCDFKISPKTATESHPGHKHFCPIFY